jgi:predicted RNase H-like nuclease (RuvC/YqgF family)
LLDYLIEQKIKNISLSVNDPENLKKKIYRNLQIFSAIVSENNDKIKELNKKKNHANEESKNVKKDLCKVVFNNLVENQKNHIKRLEDLSSEISELESEIKSLSQKMKISKKEKVADTIENVLKRFFGDKYTINKKNFRLSLNNVSIG